MSIEKQLQSLSTGTGGDGTADAIAISNLEEQVKCAVEVNIQTCSKNTSKLPWVGLWHHKPTGTFLALYSNSLHVQGVERWSGVIPALKLRSLVNTWWDGAGRVVLRERVLISVEYAPSAPEDYISTLDITE